MSVIGLLTDPCSLAVLLLATLLVWYLMSSDGLPKGPGQIMSILYMSGKCCGDFKILAMKLQDLVKDYGDVFTFYMGIGGHARNIVINSYDTMHEALVTRGTDFAGRPYIYSVEELFKDPKWPVGFGDYNEAWINVKKLAVSALKGGLEKSYLEEVTKDHVMQSLDEIRELSKTGPVDLRKPTTMITYRNFFKFLFSMTEVGFDSKEFNDTYNLLEGINKLVLVIPEDIHPIIPKLFPKTAAAKEMEKLGKAYSATFMEKVTKHAERFDPNDVKDILDHLLMMRKKAEENGEDMTYLTDEAFANVISLLFFAGTDTTSCTVYWAILYLALHQDVQEKLLEEIHSVVGQDGIPSFGHMSKMHYYNSFIYEVMRYVPNAPLSVFHKTICETTLAGYSIPKDMTVTVNLYAIYRDPKYFDGPDEFKADRFLNEDGEMKKPRHFVPFGEGKRLCIGEAIAKPVLFLIISSIVQKFHLTLPDDCVHSKDDIKYAGNIFVCSPEPFKVEVTERR